MCVCVCMRILRGKTKRLIFEEYGRIKCLRVFGSAFACLFVSASVFAFVFGRACVRVFAYKANKDN